MKVEGKLSIEKESLVAIADALRAHHGMNYSEGTTTFQPETPLILKTPNYDEYGTTPNNGEWMVGEQVVSHTYKIPGASKIVMNLSYAADMSMGTGGYNMDYIWTVEGAYKTSYMEKTGVHHQYESGSTYVHRCPECGGTATSTGATFDIGIYKGVSMGGVEWHDRTTAELYTCSSCGAEGFAYPYDIEPGGNRDYWDTFSCIDQTLNYRFKFTTEYEPGRRICKQIVFEGDAFTLGIFIWNRTQKTGYYAEVYPLDENDNLMEAYDVIVDYIPNRYTPDPDELTADTMVHAISKLNNYPNGEEVRF